MGAITNPWRPSGDLTNDGGGSANPVSGQLYTVRQSPKTIIITGGSVTEIDIDGTSTGLSVRVFKLGIGETIAVTYSSLPEHGNSGLISASPVVLVSLMNRVMYCFRGYDGVSSSQVFGGRS